MAHCINIPIQTTRKHVNTTPHESYKIQFNNLNAQLSIDKWFYCTEFNTAFDHTKIPSTTDTNNRFCHKMVSNALVERASHDITEMNLHYRLVLASLVDCIRDGEPLSGTRQCADIHASCLLSNAVINLSLLYHSCPAITRTGPNGLTMSIAIAKQFLSSPQDGTTLLKFSFDEYQNLCNNETNHLRHNDTIDSRVNVHEDMCDTWSVDRAKVVIFTDGRMIMTGAVNRRSVINAFSVVLQTLDFCQCVETR